jgi:hypothetical protein
VPLGCAAPSARARPREPAPRLLRLRPDSAIRDGAPRGCVQLPGRRGRPTCTASAQPPRLRSQALHAASRPPPNLRAVTRRFAPRAPDTPSRLARPVTRSLRRDGPRTPGAGFLPPPARAPPSRPPSAHLRRRLPASVARTDEPGSGACGLAKIIGRIAAVNPTVGAPPTNLCPARESYQPKRSSPDGYRTEAVTLAGSGLSMQRPGENRHLRIARMAAASLLLSMPLKIDTWVGSPVTSMVRSTRTVPVTFGRGIGGGFSKSTGGVTPPQHEPQSKQSSEGGHVRRTVGVGGGLSPVTHGAFGGDAIGTSVERDQNENQSAPAARPATTSRIASRLPI